MAEQLAVCLAALTVVSLGCTKVAMMAALLAKLMVVVKVELLVVC